MHCARNPRIKATSAAGRHGKQVFAGARLHRQAGDAHTARQVVARQGLQGAGAKAARVHRGVDTDASRGVLVHPHHAHGAANTGHAKTGRQRTVDHVGLRVVHRADAHIAVGVHHRARAGDGLGGAAHRQHGG